MAGMVLTVVGKERWLGTPQPQFLYHKFVNLDPVITLLLSSILGYILDIIINKLCILLVSSEEYWSLFFLINSQLS